MDTPGVDGVSVVVPTYQGVRHLQRCLDSLAAQTLAPELFEVVVVPNGPDDGTLALLDRVRAAHPQLRLRTVRPAERGVANATNAGMAAARHRYTTLVDDDDRVSREYLAALLTVAGPRRVGVAQIADVDANGRGAPRFDTYVNQATLGVAGIVTDVQTCPTVISFNVAKIVPTPIARSVEVDPLLRSGTDVVYWSELFHRYPLEVAVLDPKRHAVYYRSVRSGSQSRPSELDYDFGIVQRLDVIDRLAPLRADPSHRLAEVMTRTVRAQVGHMRSYLQTHPQDNERALADIRARGYDDFPYDKLAEGRAHDLVIAYAFVPSNDTSAIVTARRIRARGVVVDVVSNQPARSRREQSRSSAMITEGYVDREMVVRGAATWSNWKGIDRFCSRGMVHIEESEARKGRYRSIYSRAMWPASHFLAALYKLRNPDVPWTAEFSDPVKHDIQGNDRPGDLYETDVLAELREGLLAAGKTVPDTDNVFAWVEHLAFALADHIVFTNEQQRSYMRDYADPVNYPAFDERSEIQTHPTLPARFYDAVETEYEFDDDVVNIAYFGVFYVTRGLTELVTALGEVDPSVRDRIRLYLFTRETDELHRDLAAAHIDDLVQIRPYVPYLEFLKLTTMFDALIVNDTRTADTHAINPYMPSKWSDYNGSGSPIWAIVEPGSVMSKRDNAYTSPLGDVAAARAVLESLVARKFGV